ncbi:hypothetical protein KIPB_006068 [Kipferlia bialata]|uniref:Uncharacterized protein n=1 Tax=Kipferlia bialata TaxID=797122 RepID=A0A391NKH2_9EUKA|nr:hypothetical protein KIPB_004090 [Kipferlia bialata]GCA62829.1 hypothetical protein KIPB_006068 [Kipferlia bialata]|eukprot:g4090.t1
MAEMRDGLSDATMEDALEDVLDCNRRALEELGEEWREEPLEAPDTRTQCASVTEYPSCGNHILKSVIAVFCGKARPGILCIPRGHFAYALTDTDAEVQ